MENDEIREYVGKEILLITKDGFRNYGIIETVNDSTTKMKSPHGKVTIVSEEIVLIREKKVVWE